MNTTTYPGIDYSRGISNCDLATGIRYGVISQNSVSPDAIEDIFTHGEDKAWERAKEEALREARMKARADAAAKGEDPDEAEEDVDEDRISDELGMSWETSLGNYLYERDGYKLTGCLDNDLFVLRSPYYTFAQFCSPCVPGAANLDSPFEPATPLDTSKPFPDLSAFAGLAEQYATLAADCGFPRAYCLGHDWFDDGKAPYPVFSVETGKLVEPSA